MQTFESILQTLSREAWDRDVTWDDIIAWTQNFTGRSYDIIDENKHALFLLSRFMYFSRRLVREMLKSLYRDHFESPLIQRIRRNCRDTTDTNNLRRLYSQELSATRFVGLGNPAESGAHLLYYFRQVNYLEKGLFVDAASAFSPRIDPRSGRIQYRPTDQTVTRYVFFDDLVGSGDQSTLYLSRTLGRLKKHYPDIDFRFMSLFATARGLARLNDNALFDGKASTLFELDDSFKAFDPDSRYFLNSPSNIDPLKARQLAEHYGSTIWPKHPLGYNDGQLLLGFFHNTPDNALPIFWENGRRISWSPVFVRFHKNYGSTT